MPILRDVTQALEAWAPRGSAQSYDNVGLQVGDPERDVHQALIALDLTPAVIDEAGQIGADLIITHHPAIFRPIRRVTSTEFVPNLILRLASSGLSYYAIHTNLDAAPDGVSFALAERLGLTSVGFLDSLSDHLKKLVTFVPASHARAVHEAMAGAGAGRVGPYEACAFESDGTGYYQDLEKAGGSLESVRDVRLEMDVPDWLLAPVVRAMRESHPYENVAYDVYPLEKGYGRAGLGAVGTLPEPMPLHAFLARVAERLETRAVRYAGSSGQTLHTVAVCGGSGSSLIPQALRAGADAFVTADVTYHTYFDVFTPDGRHRMALIDPGHYETEALTETLLQTWLTERFPDVAWTRTTVKTNPMRTFIWENY